MLLGLIDGSFYALLSLGLAVIFGMLNIINFAHGAQYMMGAFAAFPAAGQARHRLLAGAGVWCPSSSVPFGIVIERLLLQWLYKLDHLYGLLLTFGLALVIEGVFRQLLRRVQASLRRCRNCCGALRISASCFCPTTAPG